MSYSKETLETVARELYGKEVAAGETGEVLHWVNLCLEGLAELDALDLDAQEPVPVVEILPPDSERGK
jgi:hypothetical protein